MDRFSSCFIIWVLKIKFHLTAIQYDKHTNWMLPISMVFVVTFVYSSCASIQCITLALLSCKHRNVISNEIVRISDKARTHTIQQSKRFDWNIFGKLIVEPIKIAKKWCSKVLWYGKKISSNFIFIEWNFASKIHLLAFVWM